MIDTKPNLSKKTKYVVEKWVVEKWVERRNIGCWIGRIGWINELVDWWIWFLLFCRTNALQKRLWQKKKQSRILTNLVLLNSLFSSTTSAKCSPKLMNNPALPQNRLHISSFTHSHHQKKYVVFATTLQHSTHSPQRQHNKNSHNVPSSQAFHRYIPLIYQASCVCFQIHQIKTTQPSLINQYQ